MGIATKTYQFGFVTGLSMSGRDKSPENIGAPAHMESTIFPTFVIILNPETL